MITPQYTLPIVPHSSLAQPEAPADFGLRYEPERARSSVLSDAFGRQHTYLRISLVERCNLRCIYCMPAEGITLSPDDHLLTRAEIRRLASLFVSAGVTKIRLTGGEPLLRRDVTAIAEDLGTLSGVRELAITTNGLLLPRKLQELRAAGVTHVNVSLDTLRPDRFERLTRRRGLEQVLKAIDQAITAGYRPLKINCVVMRGYNDDELVDFAAWTEDRDVDVRFIEFMPFSGNGWDDARLVPYAEMREAIERRFALESLTTSPHDTARTFRIPGFAGRISFTTSMTQHFCEGCNRIRITADGNLKVCLFGGAEVSLRDAMRSGMEDEALRSLISESIGRKKARHAGMHDLARLPNRPMITIGG